MTSIEYRESSIEFFSFTNPIHSLSTKQTYDVQNLLKTKFFYAQSQCWQQPLLSGKEISQNAIDLFFRCPIIALKFDDRCRMLVEYRESSIEK